MLLFCVQTLLVLVFCVQTLLVLVFCVLTLLVLVLCVQTLLVLVFCVQTRLVLVFCVQDVPGEEVEELKEFEREHLQQLDTQALNIELTQVDDKLSASR